MKINEILIILLTIFIIIFGIMIILTMLQHFFATYNSSGNVFCDYDSCSQEIDSWEYNGSICFDNNNSDCQNFLKLWRACQHYKQRLGVC